MSNPTCGSCRFWFDYPAAPGGECRRYAPRPRAVTPARLEAEAAGLAGHPEFFTWWQHTDIDDWCGEWEPASSGGRG